MIVYGLWIVVKLIKTVGGNKNVNFMVWLGVCVTPLVILDKGTIDHERYIREVLPVVINYGNKMFGDDWTYQQDGATSHTHELTQQWCKNNFP